MSATPNRMRPASGARLPEICAMSVVLPAPFGPISACTSPRVTSNVTPSVATTPPKRFCRPSMRRSSSAILLCPALEEARDALRREQHHREQEHADREQRMLLVVRVQGREPADLVVG